MSVIYCSECGKKHEYGFAKPNFCSSCGTSLGPSVVSKASNKSRVTKVARDEEDEYEDDGEFSDCDEIPDIDKIQVDIESFDASNTFSLGSIFGQPQEPKQTSRKRPISLENFKNNKK
jgi:hypothetical protein